MYRRLSAVMFPVLTLVLIGTLFWGYQENQEKNAVLIQAENQYQRAFHDLSYHIDQLHDELGNALAVNAESHTFHRKCLLNVWRITSEAQSEINQLPLTLLPFHETSKFLANIASFSYRTAIENYGENPLTPQQIKTMQELYQRADEVAKDLRNVQTKVLGENLRWMDVELAMASEDAQMDNQIIDGFKTVDQKITGFSEMSWEPSMTSVNREQMYQQLSGEWVTPEQVKQQTITFFHLPSSQEMQVVENGKDTTMHTYSVTVPFENGQFLNADYTTKGGHLIWFLYDREIGKQNINVTQAKAKAKQFAEKHGYNGLTVINHDQYGGTATFTLAETQNGIVVYPKKISVNVALDTGEVIGMQAMDYVFENKERTVEQPTLSVEEAKKSLNPDFKIQDHAVALIKNDFEDEVICHVFTGSINGGLYRLYINGENGQEEKMERLNTIEIQGS